MWKCTVVAVLALAALSTGCVENGSTSDDDIIKNEEMLASHREHFTQVARSSYEFTWKRDCLCMEEIVQPYRVRVENGVITRIVDVATKTPVAAETYTRFATIPGVFDMIQTHIEGEADGVQVVYENTLSYPTTVTIDFIENARDDEMTLHLSDFVSPAPAL